MIAYSHSVSVYDNKGQRHYSYGSPRPVPEREPDPEPLKLAPLPLTPIAFVVDGADIVADLHQRKGVRIPTRVNGRRLTVEHPEALNYQGRSDSGGRRVLVRVECVTCGSSKLMHMSEWTGGRGCRRCALKVMGRRISVAFVKNDSNVIPLFTPFGRRK